MIYKSKKTTVKIDKPAISISLNDTITCIGSCFSGEIAHVLSQYGCNLLINPFGTIYNPYSIYQVFEKIFSLTEYRSKDLTHYNHTFFSLDHATEFDSPELLKVLERINLNIQAAYQKLMKSNIFIITLGTSIIYHYRKTGQIVANCHRMPQQEFERRILTVEEIVQYLNRLTALIFSRIPNAAIIFTLSPVRHNPGNLVENSFSKALLRTGIEAVVNHKNILYFPVYEIIIDELRDYRFFKNDGLHLKKTTIHYVMEIFYQTYFTPDFIEFIRQVHSIQQIFRHTPRDPSSAAYLDLLADALKKLNQLSLQFSPDRLSSEKFRLGKKILRYYPAEKSREIFFNGQFIANSSLTQLFQTAWLIKNNQFNLSVGSIGEQQYSTTSLGGIGEQQYPMNTFPDTFIQLHDNKNIRKFKNALLLKYYRNNKTV